MMNYEEDTRRYAVEVGEKWKELWTSIPKLKFKEKWDVLIAPPFGGAVARLWIYYKDRAISVYLDWYDRLGCMNKPYYEIYPIEGIQDKETQRFTLDQVDLMMKTINELLGE